MLNFLLLTGTSFSFLLSVRSFERQDPSGFPNKDVLVSEHKCANLEGHHTEEHLLIENPHHYVLLSIKDMDVI